MGRILLRRNGASSWPLLAAVVVLLVIATSGFSLYFGSISRPSIFTLTSLSLSTITVTSNSTITVESTVAQEQSGTPSVRSSSTLTSTTSSSSGAVFQGVLVIIPAGVATNQSLNFTPSVIKVVMGVNNTVTWLNQDKTQHTVAYQSVPYPVHYIEALVQPGGTFTATLTVPGTYRYNCMWHPGWMKGTILVLGA